MFLIQPSCPPVNDHLMELLVTIDACKRASARSITAVVPYYGYARADRKTQGRESIAAKLTANLVTEAGMNCYFCILPTLLRMQLGLSRSMQPRAALLCFSGIQYGKECQGQTLGQAILSLGNKWCIGGMSSALDCAVAMGPARAVQCAGGSSGRSPDVALVPDQCTLGMAHA